MKKISVGIFILTAAILASNGTSYGQDAQATPAPVSPLGGETEKNIELLRQDLRSGKKQIITQNVPLSPDEAAKFWPVYDQYVFEMKAANDKFYAIVEEYAAKQLTITEPQAADIVKRWIDAQSDQLKVRQRFIPLFEKAIPSKKVALFVQIDRRIYALMDLQVSSLIPLVAQ